jgi:pimeloyl-ACP methyl ester carboxylesterase
MVAFLILILALLVLLLVGSVTINLLFWYEALQDGHAARLKKQMGKPWSWIVLHGLFSTTVAQLLVLVFTPLVFWSRTRRPTGTPGPQDPVVVFVHGLYHNASAWALFKHRFHHAGLACAYALSCNTLTRDLWQASDTVATDLKRIAARHPDHQLFLVGHSMGGLVIRACLRDEEIRERTLGAASLGTPHRGSRMAALGIGPSARCLEYESPDMGRLNQEAVPRIPFLCLYSEFDNMVLPASGLHPPDNAPWRVEVAPALCHVCLLYSRAVTWQVLNFIKETAASSSSRD